MESSPTVWSAIVAGVFLLVSGALGIRLRGALEREKQRGDIGARNLEAQLTGWQSYSKSLSDEIERLQETERGLRTDLREAEEERDRLRRRTAALERRLGITQTDPDHE